MAGGSCGVRGVMAQREDTRSSNDIISNLSRPSRSPTPRHSTTWASDTIAKEDKQRGTVGSGRGLWAVELKKRWGTDCERAGRQVPAMNVETKALIWRRQDRDGRPRTKTFPRPAQVFWGEHQRGRRPISCPSRFMPDQFWSLGARRCDTTWWPSGHALAKTERQTLVL